MIEVISIFAQFFIFLIFFSFPFTPKTLNKTLNFNNVLDLIDAHAINIIFFLYFCLLLSFFNIDLKFLFNIYFILSFGFIIFNYREFKFGIKTSKLFVFFLFFLVVLSLFFNIAQNLRLESDGHMWLEKALVFFNGDKIQSMPNVPTHPEYPHLGSFLWAFFWKNSIMELEYFGRYFQPYFYILSVFLFAKCINFKNINLKIFFILFFILITYDAFLFAGYQEYLIFTSLLVAARYIYLIDFEKTINSKFIFLVLSILYINCWFKDEGTVYFIIFSTLLVFVSNKSIQSKVLFYISIIILLSLQFFLQKYVIGLHGFPHNNLLSLVSLMSDPLLMITKFLKILIGFIISFIKYPLWIIILACGLLNIFIFKKFQKINKYFTWCLILNFGFIFLIFLSFDNYEWYIKVTLDRLLFQTSGFYSILFILFLKNLKFLKI